MRRWTDRSHETVVLAVAVLVIAIVLLLTSCSDDVMKPRYSNGNEVELIDCALTPDHAICRMTPELQVAPEVEPDQPRNLT